MAALPSGCPMASSCLVGGRRRAAVDDIDLAAIPVDDGLRDGWRTVGMVRRPLPLILRAMTLPRFASHCTGTESAASPRCWGVPAVEIHRPVVGWRAGGSTVGSTAWFGFATWHGLHFYGVSSFG